MKKELLEIKRTLTIDRYNITRITGYIVDNDRNCRLEFVKNFLNLEETETFKYLDIFKKVLSGKPGRNMFQLDFEGKTRKQHLATIVKTGLEDNDVRQIFLEEIAESIDISNKGYSLILIASGIYDIPGIATDGADLDESEEVYLVFDGKCLEVYLVTTKYGSSDQDKVYPFRAFWNGINFTDGWGILDVIAWMPLPEPYKEAEDE